MAKIALISDSHDNLPVLRAALAAIRAAEADLLLHLGDLCAPFVVTELSQGFAGPIHIVMGNNDADGRLLQTMASRNAQVNLYGVYTELAVEGRSLALIHYPEPARRIAQSGALDLVAYGHNHQKHMEQVGPTWLVNPGELLGLAGSPTWALYDSATHTVEIRDVAGED
jgi:putative phosphoesterase